MMNKNSQLIDAPLVQYLKTNLLRPLEDKPFSISDASKNHSLSEILPYDPNTKSDDQLISGMKEYDFLLTATENAAQLLSKKHIACFDPLVGENACQIRALKNCLIFSTYPVNGDDLFAKVQFAREKIDSLFKDTSAFTKNKFSLGKILENNDIDIKLNYREMYLIQSYLLTFIKTIKPPKQELPFVENAYTDTKKLRLIKPIARLFAERLINKLRKSLSSLSVSFVQEISSRIAPDFLHDALSDRFCVCHNHLHCLPCYWVTKLLMIQALKSQVPLIVIARQMAKDQNYDIICEVPLIFKPTIFGYQQSSINAFKLNTPSMLLLVNACRQIHEFPNFTTWKKELLKYNPINLILAYAASHRQYPDITQDKLVDKIQDQQYIFYKEKALEWGCSIENPSGFFLSHAFCEQIENISNHFSLEGSKQILNSQKI